MLDDYEEFISLTLRTKCSKKPLSMLERNWKHQWFPLCFARHARNARMGRPVARLMISSQHLRVSWETSEFTRMWKEESPPNYHECHIAGRGDNSLQHYNLVHKFIPMPQALKIPAAKAAADKEWEKLETILAWDLTKVRSKSEVIDKARTKGAKVHFTSLMDICHWKNAELEAKHQKIQRSSCTPRWYCKRWFWILCSIHRTRIISISNDSRQNHGYHFQTAKLRRTSSWRSISFYSSENGRCSQIIENSKIGLSRHLDSSTMTQMA